MTNSSPIIRRKVRGRHRRILLLTLSEGSGTVSSIALKSSLRVPHVSVELKRMREEGLVNSTSISGTRGGMLSLTSKGFKMLEMDELSRIPLGLFNHIVDEQFQILDILGNYVLLMVTRKPTSALIYLPTIDGRRVLAETRERNPRYYDSDSFERIAMPVQSNPGNIESWDRSGFGLVRSRLVDSDSADRLSIGRWFHSIPNIENIDQPDEFRSESWQIGSIGRDGTEVFASGPVMCTSNSNEIAGQLMQNSEQGSILIGRQTIVSSQPGPLPRIILEEWIELIHPRLRQVTRRSRLQLLLSWIDTGRNSRPSRLPDVTIRRFREDWGNRQFLQSNSPFPETIVTDGLGPMAIKALILSIMNHQSIEWVSIDLPEPIGESLSRRLFRFERIRLLIAPWSSTNDIGLSILETDEIHDLPFLRFTESNGRTLPVYIGDTRKRKTILPKDWKIPTSPDELKRISHKFQLMDLPKDESNENELFLYACSVFPEGDEAFSNRIESINPLISWISSSNDSRIDRWIRIWNLLPSSWSKLINPNETSLDRIGDLWDKVPISWMDDFNQSVSNRITSEENLRSNLKKLTMYANNPEIRGWAAGRLLSVTHWLNSDETRELVRWGINSWIEFPPLRCADSLEGVLYLLQKHPDIRQGNIEEISERLRRLAWSLPENHDLHLWILLSEWNERGTLPTIDKQILFVKYLPWRWWRSHSADMLTMMTEHSDARRAILQNPLPWPAIVLRPEGEKAPLPFGFDGVHPKMRLSLADRLRRFVSMETSETESFNSIFDIIDSLDDLRDENSPRNGKTHRYVGWLTRPVHEWPPFHRLSEESGDTSITLAIGERLGDFS